MPDLMSSSSDPFAELYVFQSVRPFSTSSNRLSAKKSCFAL